MKMYFLLILVSLFTLIYSSPTQKEIQEIIRHFQKTTEHDGIETDVKQKLFLASKFTNDVLKNVDLKHSVPVNGTDNSSGCTCQNYNCGCCVHLEVKEIDLNDKVCVNFSYLPAPEYGLSITLTIDDKTIINATISARNPPPLCIDIPYLKKYASLCLEFKDLDVSNKTFSGCVFVTFRLILVKIETVKIGCFKIPPGNDTLTQGPDSGLSSRIDGIRVKGLGYKSSHREGSKLYFKPLGKQKVDRYAQRQKVLV